MQPLHPFEPRPELATIQLSGEAIWCQGVLRLRFVLHSPAQGLKLPPASGTPARRNGLWQNTCFEAFIARAGDEAYWELNLAPNGDWNVYALSGYRENLQECNGIRSLPYQLHRSNRRLELACELDLNRWFTSDQELELSLTAVLEHPEHGCSYWAWQHKGDQADFHLRPSFQRLQPCQA